MGLDGVEILMTMEETFGITIPDEAATSMATVQGAIDYVAEHVPTVPQETCQTQRIYHRLRRGFQSQIPALAGDFRLQTEIKDVLHKDQWPRVWAAVRREVGEDFWPEVIPWGGLWFKWNPRTVRELVYHIAFELPKPDVTQAEPWTRERIALEIRRIVTEQMGISNDFRQSADFGKDLGVWG